MISKTIEDWVDSVAKLTTPKKVLWCDGSERERETLVQQLFDEHKNGGRPFLKINQKKYPGGFWYSSDPSDVARSTEITYICTPKKEEAGPTNNWMNPMVAKNKGETLLQGSMRGRTMFVVPFSLGPADSPWSRTGIQITDSPYVVLNKHLLYRVGEMSRDTDEKNIMWGVHTLRDLNPQNRCVLHFPEENLVWSIGSGYGGNALLGKKCFSLRLATHSGLKEGWLPEHMMVIGLEDPDGEVTYIAGAFPSACGKTNLAMLRSSLPGYKVWTISDDLCWMFPGKDGRLRAISIEKGFFGVAPGTSIDTNPNMMEAVKQNTIFTNVGLTRNREPWWEGIGYDPPSGLRDWQTKRWNKENGPAAHPNARFTVPAKHCTFMSPRWNDPDGVPISAILFGGRRSDTMPLVYQTFNWQHGIFVGLSLASHTTAAETGAIGTLRRDPFAMLPFLGINIGDYVKLHLDVGRQLTKPPKIFGWNVFRKDENGKYFWPGFKENARILKWIVDRVKRKFNFRGSPLGLIPDHNAIELDGLNLHENIMEKLLQVDRGQCEKEAESLSQYFDTLGEKLPQEMKNELTGLQSRLKPQWMNSVQPQSSKK